MTTAAKGHVGAQPPGLFTKQNRALLRQLVVTDFKLRYQGSVLGYIWSLLRPLLLFTILYFVFGEFLRIGAGIDHYPVYLLLGLVLWGFFSEATIAGLSSVVNRGELLRKIAFPKYIVVVSGTVSALINLSLNLIVVGIFAAATGIRLDSTMAFFPLFLIELYVLALGLAFFLSAAYVKFRDVGYIWEVILQAAFYAVPIIYPLSFVSDAHPQIARILMLNPVAQAIQDSRYSIVSHQAVRLVDLVHGSAWTLVPILLVALITAGGTAYFRRRSPWFAEII